MNNIITFDSIPRQLKSKDIPKMREWLLRLQNGNCFICGREPLIPCLDHSHKKKVKGSGLIRGVLCSPCNVFIAKSENNAVRYGIKKEDLPMILRRMAKYLEKKHFPYIHPSEKQREFKLKQASFNSLNKAYMLKYPNRQPLEYPASEKCGKRLKELFNELEIEPVFLKATIKKRKRKTAETNEEW